MLQIRRILVPIDDTALTERVLDHAFTLAGRFGAKVSVLYVREDPQARTVDDIARDEAEVELERAAARQTALRRLEPAHGLPADRVEGEVRTGDPATCIVEAADDLGVDLIVMGTHGVAGLVDRLVGTTTERVLLRARQALHVVRDVE